MYMYYILCLGWLQFELHIRVYVDGDFSVAGRYAPADALSRAVPQVSYEPVTHTFISYILFC